MSALGWFVLVAILIIPAAVAMSCRGLDDDELAR